MATSPTIRPDELLTSGQTTHVLHIDKSTLSRWVAAGRLEPVLIGGIRFFHRADVDRIAAERAAS